MRFFSKGKSGRQIEFAVCDMHCGHCELTVKNALRRVDGVLDVKVNRHNNRAIATINPDKEITVEGLITAVNTTGYRAKPLDKS
jgi:copper chaperone CopZ